MRNARSIFCKPVNATLCARPDDEVPENAAAFWIFRTDDAEAEWLANFIAQDIEANADEGRCPDDFALIVRVRPDQTEKQLEDTFGAHGLLLRNEARLVKGIAIQDLMSDELVSLLLGLMRVALGIRGSDVYGRVQETLGGLLGIDYQNQGDAKRLENTVRGIIGVIKDLTAPLLPKQIWTYWSAPLWARLALPPCDEHFGSMTTKPTFVMFRRPWPH